MIIDNTEELPSDYRLHCISELLKYKVCKSFELARNMEDIIFEFCFTKNDMNYMNPRPAYLYQEKMIEVTKHFMNQYWNRKELLRLLCQSFQQQDETTTTTTTTKVTDDEDNQDNEDNEDNNNEDGLIKCKFCKSSKYVNFYEKQTRSADEPATLFIECTKCNKKWRQY